MINPENVQIATLGKPQIVSPLKLAPEPGQGVAPFLPDEARVRYSVELPTGAPPEEEILFEKAGPRRMIFFRPSEVKAAVVTCGGLCPGINNVIRSLVLELYENYGVHRILGLRFGYQGLNPEKAHPPLFLTPELVEDIHKDGGTLLGSSRGEEDPAVMVDFLVREGINLLFCVGGDGTQRGAHLIYEEARNRGVQLALVGIPKTIDNDIPFVYRSFGLSTALEKTKEIILCAHTEAKGHPNGIGLVKVMGRDAGFIAAGATVASQEVNFTLIPEIPFQLEGEKGFLHALTRRIQTDGHAVIVVAEGAGQHLIEGERIECDASGNIRYHDIGALLKQKINEHFQAQGLPVNLKYFDPSYAIRSVPANSDDSLLCDQLARHAAHAAMSGKTDLLIGYWHNVFIHIPIPLVTQSRKQVSPESGLWMGVLSSTGQLPCYG